MVNSYVLAGGFERDSDYIPDRITWDSPTFDPTRIVPAGPDPAVWAEPHGRS